jgi:arylsulfatase A-like enzyme
MQRTEEDAMKTMSLLTAVALVLCASIVVPLALAQDREGSLDRSVLPIPEPNYPHSTGFFGKNHETAPWEVSVSGPTDRWPSRSGFDKFYGFFGGETDQWNPTIYDGLARIPTPHTPGYNFMTDMTDQAISWMKL